MVASVKRTQKEEPNTAEERPEEELESRIAECAYYKAANRGFEPGHELEDWLEAEREFTL